MRTNNKAVANGKELATNYTAGDNITITDGVISASGGEQWEDISHLFAAPIYTESGITRIFNSNDPPEALDGQNIRLTVPSIRRVADFPTDPINTSYVVLPAFLGIQPRSHKPQLKIAINQDAMEFVDSAVFVDTKLLGGILVPIVVYNYGMMIDASVAIAEELTIKIERLVSNE